MWDPSFISFASPPTATDGHVDDVVMFLGSLPTVFLADVAMFHVVRVRGE